MKVLKNTNSHVNVYIGNFAADSIDSDFNAEQMVTFTYSDFMAWVYQNCDCMMFAHKVYFVMSDYKLVNSIKTCFDECEKQLQYTGTNI